MASQTLLGRTDELALIGEVIGSFPDGDRALVLSGDAGIGKTVLWEEAEHQARARGGITVLTSRASAVETDLAYAVLTDLLGAIAPAALPTLPRPQADALAAALLLDPPDLRGSSRKATPAATIDPRTVATAVLGTLRAAAAEQPVLLAIDDVQWVDPASAAALEFALRRAIDLPIGILATLRTPAQAPASATGIVAALGDRMRSLDVGPISLGVLHHLIRNRAGASLTRPQLVRLEEASRGNPLLAIEMARELARLDHWPIVGEPLPIPNDVSGLLADRLRRLSELERDALFVAAAMSSPTIDLVATALVAPGNGVDEEGGPNAAPDRTSRRAAIDRAIDDGLLVPASHGALRFGHPLMAEAALGAVTPVRARRIHGRLAELARSVEDRGRHVALAADGPSSEAAERVEAAARSARTRGATAVAAGWAEAAARLTPDEDGAGRASRLIEAGRWFADAGEIERGRGLLERAIADLPPGDTRAAARLSLAQLSGWDGGPAAVVSGCEAALAEARDPDLRARIRLRLAGEPDVLGFGSAIGHADAAIAELEAVDAPDPDLLACALLQSAQFRLEAGVADDVAAVERGASLLAAEPRRSHDGEVRPESLRAHALRWQWAADHDDLGPALAGALVEIRRTRDLLGMDRPVPILEADIAYLMAWAGDLAGARDHARAALEAADLLGTREGRSAALAGLGVVALHAGDITAAEEAARSGLALGADPPDWLDARHEANLGAAALAGGDAPMATSVLGELFDRLVELGATGSTNLRFASDLVEAAIAAGDLERAARVIDSLERTYSISPTPWVSVVAARGRALLFAAKGDLDAAADAASIALQAAADLPMPIERGRTELVAGRIARRRKEKRRAAEHLDRAIEMFHAIGAKAWLANAEADLARLGRHRGSEDELTETEDRVARLAAAGMTNREVGEAAFLTPKSVEGVLARVYGKLGIRSRAELGAWLAGQAPSDQPPAGSVRCGPERGVRRSGGSGS
jgi:DNA-binding CsgD family transcriptional regulator